MFKNKYIFWSFIGVWLVVLAGGAGWFLFLKDNRHQQASRSQSATSGDSVAQASSAVTLSAPAPTGVTIDGHTPTTGTTVGSGNTPSTEVSKLLDPTTFAQYDKYKTAQSTTYRELQVGTGATVTGGSKVAVVYRGWLTNGTMFDQSKTGEDGKIQAFSFVEGQHQVIPGWESGLEGVKEGGVRLLIVPPALAYGEAGHDPIPGNAVLIFQVQIVQVQ